MPSEAILHRTGVRVAHMTTGQPVSLEAGDQGQFIESVKPNPGNCILPALLTSFPRAVTGDQTPISHADTHVTSRGLHLQMASLNFGT